MTNYPDVRLIELEKGYQLLVDGESAGTIHKHKGYYTGTFGGNINFSNTNIFTLILDMRSFILRWRELHV